MNKTKIDWADMSWNPITGCHHKCAYCYAEKIAKRFGKMMPDLSPYPRMFNGCHMLEGGPIDGNPYPWLFEPTFHAHRIDEPMMVTDPQDIFTVSMGDMLGDWVPKAWQEEVLATIRKAYWHRFIILTKNTMGYVKLAQQNMTWPDNAWAGFSVTTQKSLEEQAFGMTWAPKNCLISIEPIHGPIDLSAVQVPGRCVTLDMLKGMRYWFGGGEPGRPALKWVIIGAETGNRIGKVIPDRRWVMSLKRQCHMAGIPLFMKDSLRDLMGADFEQDKPWKKG